MTNDAIGEKVRVDGLHWTNPLYNSRRLKLGTFSTNLSGGSAISTMEGVLKADWSVATELAKLADEMEFEAIVPVGRWRGFGGVTDFNGAGFECFTFAAGMGAQTKYPALFATSHVPSIHPVMAAKQATTVDHISGGRFALNLVTGWHKTEIEIFGAALMDHDARYDGAAEWLEIMKLLWERDEPLNYEGKFYQVREALLKPQPLQKPFPPIMCAGGSNKGRHFTSKYCDIAFTNFEDRSNLEAMRNNVEAYLRIGREEYNRDIKIWSQAYIIQADTEAEARRLYDYCVHEKGDWVAAENLTKTLGIHTEMWSKEGIQRLKEDLIAGWGAYPLIGTAEQVVDGLKLLNASGLDGVLLSWPSYLDGIKRFQRDTLPLLVQEGLR